MKKKTKKQAQKPQNQNTVSYVCSKCGETEKISADVLEYFDEINPEQLVFGPHEFKCEKCETGIMHPEEEPAIIIKGYGLYAGIENILRF